MRLSPIFYLAPLLLAAGQPQDENRGKGVPAQDNIQPLKTYPVLAEEGAKRAEKVERLKGDLHYMATDPYSDDPVEYSGTFALLRTKDSAEAYVELGVPGAGGHIQPKIRIYENATTLTIVNEEELTYVETPVDAKKPAAWRPWSLLVHPPGKEALEAFDVSIADDGEPRKISIPLTEEDMKAWYGDEVSKEDYKRLMAANAKTAKEWNEARPAIATGWKAKDKTCFMREVNLNLDRVLYFPTYIHAHNRNGTMIRLEISNLKTTDEVDPELFKIVPKLRDMKNSGGTAKYRKVS